MATVTAYSAERMKEIEDTTIVDGAVDSNGHLILVTREGEEIDAGLVKGAAGDAGTPGDPAIPSGTVAMWISNVAPTNWLVCDGSAVSRTQYASLFSAIGTTYGMGDGLTTFNLPNLKGRVPVGRDSTQAEFDTLSETGGEKTHLLKAAESGLPSHSHNVTSAGTIAGPEGKLWADYGAGGTTQVAIGQRVAATVWGQPFSAQATTAADAAQAHNNLQPYSVVNFIIKYSNGDTPGDSQLTQRVSQLETNWESNTPMDFFVYQMMGVI